MNSDGKQRFRRIWNTVAAIPPGRVASYGQIAELAGIPRGARLVGRALRQAPRELDLPWHRVLNSQGRIALPEDSSARRIQIERLIAEAVVVVGGRVKMTRYRWQPDLDELVWGPVAFDTGNLPEEEKLASRFRS